MDYRKFNLEAEIQSKLDRLAQADDHPQIAIAESAVFAAQTFLARLLEQRKFFRTDQYDDLIDCTRDLLSDLVGRAIAQEEDDRVNAGWNRACAIADMRRED